MNAGRGRIRWTVIAAATLLVITGAARANEADAGEKVRAYVDGEPVTSGEIDALGRGALVDYSQKERLRYAVRRRALVQRALKEAVYREPGYRDAMQTMREDLLVRTLLEKKSRELARTITVTDKEVAAFAARMCYTVTFFEKEFGELKPAERFMAQGIMGKPQEWDDEVTVVGCENIGPLMEDTIFAMEEGEEKVVVRGRRFTVVRLVEKKKTVGESDLPDKKRIKEYLLDTKRAEALDAWVEEVVGGARVRYVGGGD